MKEKEITIKAPAGYEIDEENSTFKCIKFKPIEKKLPKTWKEFCEIHPRIKGEAWIGELSQIQQVIHSANKSRDYSTDKMLLPNIKYAEAMLALCQLIQLRDCYNDGWQPDWTDNSIKFTIYASANVIQNNDNIWRSRILAFKTKELRNQFFENFIDLIEIAKPLL